ncbi:MAG: PAS domain-containing protein [Candidatus Symbiodolus clandestinus]
MNDQRFYSYYQTARSAVFKGLTHCQRLFPYGLALLLLALLLWDRWLSFTCCRLVWTIATLASLGIICQQQHHTKQLTQHLQAQMRAEKLYQQAITDLELAITQRGQAQVYLAHQATLLRSFLDTSPDLLYCCNEANQLFNCNRAMELLIGKSQQQLMGLTPQDLYPKTIAQQDIETNRQLFQTNRAVTYEQWLPYPDGR